MSGALGGNLSLVFHHRDDSARKLKQKSGSLSPKQIFRWCPFKLDQVVNNVPGFLLGQSGGKKTLARRLADQEHLHVYITV